jgi:Domain of unknown function (DUF4333)
MTSAEPGRPSRRGSLAPSLAIAALALTACGSTAAPLKLNTVKVERAIEQSSLTQRHKRVDVNCPSGVHQQKGLVFYCTAVFHGGRTQFVVTQLDNSGDVHYDAP